MAKTSKKIRCPWAGEKDYMIRYHDNEWGRAVHDDQKHFEFLILEGAQAGLSWDTILRKRENYRKAFSDFNPKKVALYDTKKLQALLKDEGIVRNRLKIKSVVINANAFLEVQKEFGSFDRYIWGFVGNKPIILHPKGKGDFRATSPESDALSKDLKKRGFKFVGSTIMYAYLQATGLMVEHTVSCFRYTRTIYSKKSMLVSSL